MSRSNLSRTALVSPDARARPVAQGAAFEAQIPTEVLRQNPSRSPVHHEGGARKATLPLPWRAIDRSQDRGARIAEAQRRRWRAFRYVKANSTKPWRRRGPGRHAQKPGFNP